jgi:hypothetical protein
VAKATTHKYSVVATTTLKNKDHHDGLA